MGSERWSRVDEYFEERLLPVDQALDSALVANAAAGLPLHDVAPNQRKVLHLLRWMMGAKRILEIGTLGNTARSGSPARRPRGKVVTLEARPAACGVALAKLEWAGVASSFVELRLGPATASLTALREEGLEPFDLVFIDADKLSNPAYLQDCLALSPENRDHWRQCCARRRARRPHRHRPSARGYGTAYGWKQRMGRLCAGPRHLPLTTRLAVAMPRNGGFATGR